MRIRYQLRYRYFCLGTSYHLHLEPSSIVVTKHSVAGTPRFCILLSTRRAEPAVWDAINSISILFESPEQCSDPVFLRRQNESFHAPSQNQKDALTWYSRSLSNIRLQIDRGSADPYVALITCVLYICVETLQGRVEEACNSINRV